MKSSEESHLIPPGEVIAPESLAIAKACSFARFLADVGYEAFASLRETRRCVDSRAEIVVFEVHVERPQHLENDIRGRELMAVVFDERDDNFPCVLALRADFPGVPHIILTKEEFPRQLCLYEQPFEDERLNWTPAGFLKRIRFWLAKTATGTLHAEDQPLEPLILGSRIRLIVPSSLTLSYLELKPGFLDIYRIAASSETDLTLAAYWRDPKNTDGVHAVAAVFTCQPQAHGTMRRHPVNLGDLQAICVPAGLDLTAQLGSKIRDWLVNKPAPSVLQSKLVILLLLPKTRRKGSIVESEEQWAFITAKSVEEVGVALDVIQKAGEFPGYVIGEQPINAEKINDVSIGMLQVVHALSPAAAAAMNGIEPCERNILAIGMGALGSQIFNNLMRAGFGCWSLVDPDLMLPHNAARHFLGQWAVGHTKVESMATFANAILEGKNSTIPIPANFISPGAYAKRVEDAYRAAEIILDFSASVAVSRHLAMGESKARCISAFLNPSGSSLILVVEDDKRMIRLDWIEMLYYRAVLNEPALNDSLDAPHSRLRYGNSCRDVTAILAQDDAAVWAGVGSKAIKQSIQSKAASLRVYTAQPDCQVSLFSPQISPAIRIVWRDWTIQLDEVILNKLASLRQGKLPNETGGILLGSFDSHSCNCFIVEVVPSPRNSGEWPTSYIRGCYGLQQTVEEAEKRTLGQVGYIGEWHSHPDGYDVRPSEDDSKAYAWLLSYMHLEGLPSLMLIVGENNHFCLVNDEPDL